MKAKAGLLKRPRPSLRFSETVDTVEIDAIAPAKEQGEVSSSTDHDNSSSRWYGRSDLAVFKQQAQDHLLNRSVTEETRGYERYTLERATSKKLAIRCTILAYRKQMSQEAVASVASKCSQRFVVSAFEQGCKDFAVVYHPELLHLIPKVSDPTKLMVGEKKTEGNNTMSSSSSSQSCGQRHRQPRKVSI